MSLMVLEIVGSFGVVQHHADGTTVDPATPKVVIFARWPSLPKGQV